MSRYDDEHSDLGGDIGGFFGAMVAGAIIAFLIVITMELVRLHRETPPWSDTEGGQKMRIAALLFLGTIGLSVLLFQFPATLSIAPWPASIGFLLWVIALEWINIAYAQPVPADDPSLEDDLAPWRFKTTKSDNQEEQKEPVAANIFR